MRPRRGAVAATAVAALLGATVLAGCGTQRAGTASSPAAPTAVQPTPSADDFVASVMRTRDLATADLEVTVSTDVGGVTRTLAGEGEAAIAQGYADMTWTDGVGGVTRELSNGKGLFVQTDVPDGLWTRLPDERATPTSRIADPLRGLGGVQGVTRVGPEDLDGILTTRFTGTLPVTPESLALLGFSDEELVEIGTDGQGEAIDVTVWIDGKGRVVGVERRLDLAEPAAGTVSSDTMTVLSDFTTTLDLEPPPTESVVEAPDAQ